jgi:hypothetical protein
MDIRRREQLWERKVPQGRGEPMSKGAQNIVRKARAHGRVCNKPKAGTGIQQRGGRILVAHAAGSHQSRLPLLVAALDVGNLTLLNHRTQQSLWIAGAPCDMPKRPKPARYRHTYMHIFIRTCTCNDLWRLQPSRCNNKI